MNYGINEILSLSDNREFLVINAVTIDDAEYLYLKNIEVDQYTIVKVINDRIFNLSQNELLLVIENFYRSRWA